MILKNKTIVFLAVMVALAIVFVVFWINPVFSGIRKDSANLVAAKQEAASLEAENEKLKAFQDFYQEHKENLAKADNLLVDSLVPVEFISFLEKTGRDLDVSINIAPTIPVKNSTTTWSSLSFQLSARGYLANILNYLGKLESAPYLIDLQSINILSSSDPGDVVATFYIDVFAR